MIILTKSLGQGEIRWRGIVIPRRKKELFPPPGVLFDLSDKITTYKVKVDKQYRIYNLWPGSQTPKEKFYIGVLQKGMYILKLNISAYNRTKGILLSRESFELDIVVQ